MPSVRFLFEVGVGKTAEQAVATLGYDVKSLRSIDSRLPDEQVLMIAKFEKRIVVTMDKDFGELVFREGHGHVGVLLLRMEDANGQQKARALKKIVLGYADQLAGHFSVYHNGLLRIR